MRDRGNDEEVTPSRGPIIATVGTLAAPVRRPVLRVLAAMERRGFRPRLFETLRTAGRAAWLKQKGTGILRSTHRLGLAADIIDADKMWSASPAFWDALAEEAAREGFVQVRNDRPHIQAITVPEQATAWGYADAGDWDAVEALAEASMASRRRRDPDAVA